MRNRRRTPVLGSSLFQVGLTTCALLFPIVGEIAKNSVPKSWESYRWWAVPLVVLVAAGAAAAQVWQRRDKDRVDAEQDGRLLARAADDVATAVARQWSLEAERRSLRRPDPLRVRWSSTRRPVAAQAPAVLIRTMGPRPLRLKLHGDLTDTVSKFRLLPARQLVVLGEPGAGKTVLVILLTLGLLSDAEPDEPVPVLLPLSSWNPHREHLDTWFTRRLVEEHPWLANTDAYGPDAAARLVAQGRLMPVLDGLDELAPGLHAAAIDALDQAVAGARPLVITCRSAEYELAVRRGGTILARGAVVEIDPVEPEDAITFLTARQSAGDVRWKLVIEHLRTHPNGLLAQVLSTPLMVDLTRIAYTRLDTDPAELCDATRFPDRATIEEHLVDAFLPALYTDHPLPSPPDTQAAGDYRLEQAHRWLTFLAVHLDRLGTRDLAWWQLYQGVPRAVRGLAFGLVNGLVFGLAGALADALSYGPRFGLPPGVAGGLDFGLLFGVAGVLAGILRQRATPSQVEVRFRGTAVRFLRRSVLGLIVGLTAVVAVGVGLIVGIAGGLAFGLALGIQVWVDTPTDPATVSTPSTVLKQDRLATLVFGCSVGLAIGLVSGLVVGLMGGPAGGLMFGLVCGVGCGLAGLLAFGFAYQPGVAAAYGLAFGLVAAIGGGVAYAPPGGLPGWLAFGLLYALAIGLAVGLSRAWGRFVISRICLALRGHQPWLLMRFLADAHRRGVLRQAGGVYQFRHARLQEHLASMA